MKAVIFIIFNVVLLGNIQLILAQKLSFTYDEAGNQQKREWLCINCPPNLTSENSHTKNEFPIKIGDISLLSDPINQTIELSWLKGSFPFLQKIKIFDAQGKSVFNITFKPGQNSERFSFSNLPPGDYQLLGQYSNKKEFTIQVIKI